MESSVVLYRSSQQINLSILRWQRRFLFSTHVTAFVLFCVLQAVFFPLDWVAIGLRAFLMVTVIAHFSWLYMASIQTGVVAREWVPVEIAPPAVPLLTDGQQARRQLVNRDDFWYRWHDLR